MSGVRPMILPKVIGHRGAAAYAPENTLESLREAARRGASWVEFDVKLTADGVPVLMHDDRLDRTTDGKGAVAATSYEQIRALDAGAWFAPAFAGARVPTLAAALDLLLAKGLGANIEIKPCPGREVETAARAVAEIRRRWPSDRPAPLISSFRPESLAAAKAAAPELPRGLLIWEDGIATWRATARELGCATVHCSEHNLTADWAAEIRAAGYGLAVYTVNDPDKARRLVAWGIQAIITDAPDRILKALPAERA
jgi:glycerophosphoryl diester phosphodiesterase